MKTTTNTKNILTLRAMRCHGDPVIHGDDLVGVIECMTRHLDGVANRPYEIALVARDGWHRIGSVRSGGAPQAVYGDDGALRAATYLRRQTVRALAATVDTADSILGTTHPLARYLDTLREGCGPETYRTPGRDYETPARRGCDLRRDEAVQS
jgi:hypothetical protein